MDRRLGIEPSSTGLQPARSPFACDGWHRGRDSNPRLRFWRPKSWPLDDPDNSGAPGRIRTYTNPILSRAPLPVGLQEQTLVAEERVELSRPKAPVSKTGVASNYTT